MEERENRRMQLPGGTETILSEFSLGGTQKVFCNDGYVYLGADYVGKP